jgi:phosphoribosyl-AMP cyclohydrolase
MSIQTLLDIVTFNTKGLVTAIAQDYATNEVLMVAYMNADTLRQTLATGLMTYWSRSRQEVWVKGATSGHTQHVREVRVDCDGDALLFKVEQEGAACHTGHRSCFFRTFEDGGVRILDF